MCKRVRACVYEAQTFLWLVRSNSMRNDDLTVSRVGTMMSEYLILASTDNSPNRSIQPIHWICRHTKNIINLGTQMQAYVMTHA